MSEEKTLKEYYKIVKEFIPDLLTTFPEYKERLNEGIIEILSDNWESEEALKVYEHSKSVLPERFFDILYQNEEIFSDKKINTEFIPNIDFSDLWNIEGLTEKTKKVLWKYLQLLLFSLVSDIKDGSIFKDTAKLFEAIDQNEFKNKLEETIEGMQDLFNNEEDSEDISNINLDNLPNPDDIHNHINGMLGGKIGNLAREIAEETAEELNVNMDDVSSIGDVFNKLFKNPAKLMGIVKSVGTKLEDKMKSGELNQEDLIKEATEMMGKMNKMPGMKNMKGMLDQFGMGGLAGMMGGKNMKMNMGAMQSHLKGMQNKERMKKKLEERRQQREDCFSSENTIENTIGQKVFKKGEAPERSKRVKKIEDFDEGIKIEKHSKKPKNKNKKKKNKNKMI
jgi:hypothetical protein